VVGFTTGSRGEVAGKRKPVIREHDDDDVHSSIKNTGCPQIFFTLLSP
jgi:hypothetical protein